jgi:hypothetical protein
MPFEPVIDMTELFSKLLDGVVRVMPLLRRPALLLVVAIVVEIDAVGGMY